MTSHKRTLKFPAKAPPRPGMPKPWMVLTDGQLFWGQQWEMVNMAYRRPRHAMGPLQGGGGFAVTLCYGREAVFYELRQAKDLRGLDLGWRLLDFEGTGKDAQLIVRGDVRWQANS